MEGVASLLVLITTHKNAGFVISPAQLGTFVSELGRWEHLVPLAKLLVCPAARRPGTSLACTVVTAANCEVTGNVGRASKVVRNVFRSGLTGRKPKLY